MVVDFEVDAVELAVAGLAIRAGVNPFWTTKRQQLLKAKNQAEQLGNGELRTQKAF
jgi:hypothetical protein